MPFHLEDKRDESTPLASAGLREGRGTWALTTGEAGMRSQALGLAEAVGLPVEEKRVAVRGLWRHIPSGLLPIPSSAIDPASDPIAPPWPRLVVACGRRSIGPALLVKRLSGGRTLAVYIQNPDFARRAFDLVVPMPHDGVTGANVFNVSTALHGVTPAKLAEARVLWEPRLGGRPGPLIGVLVGGDVPGYRLTPAIVDQLVGVLRAAHVSQGAHVAITPSRRTSEAVRARLNGAFADAQWAWLWEASGDNPYLGILGLADRIVVTSESISMVSEALATGRPVHVLPLEGWSRRHDAFLARIIAERLVSPIVGRKLDWSFAGCGPLNATAEPAKRLRAMLGLEP